MSNFPGETTRKCLGLEAVGGLAVLKNHEEAKGRSSEGVIMFMKFKSNYGERI